MFGGDLREVRVEEASAQGLGEARPDGLRGAGEVGALAGEEGQDREGQGLVAGEGGDGLHGVPGVADERAEGGLAERALASKGLEQGLVGALALTTDGLEEGVDNLLRGEPRDLRVNVAVLDGAEQPLAAQCRMSAARAPRLLASSSSTTLASRFPQISPRAASIWPSALIAWVSASLRQVPPSSASSRVKRFIMARRAGSIDAPRARSQASTRSSLQELW